MLGHERTHNQMSNTDKGELCFIKKTFLDVSLDRANPR